MRDGVQQVSEEWCHLLTWRKLAVQWWVFTLSAKNMDAF